jgi:hypothetical protein
MILKYSKMITYKMISYFLDNFYITIWQHHSRRDNIQCYNLSNLFIPKLINPLNNNKIMIKTINFTKWYNKYRIMFKKNINKQWKNLFNRQINQNKF